MQLSHIKIGFTVQVQLWKVQIWRYGLQLEAHIERERESFPLIKKGIYAGMEKTQQTPNVAKNRQKRMYNGNGNSWRLHIPQLQLSNKHHSGKWHCWGTQQQHLLLNAIFSTHFVKTDMVKRDSAESGQNFSRKQNYQPPHCQWHYPMWYRDGSDQGVYIKPILFFFFGQNIKPIYDLKFLHYSYLHITDWTVFFYKFFINF